MRVGHAVQHKDERRFPPFPREGEHVLNFRVIRGGAQGNHPLVMPRFGNFVQLGAFRFPHHDARFLRLCGNQAQRPFQGLVPVPAQQQSVDGLAVA
jgi:hypothetical protein